MKYKEFKAALDKQFADDDEIFPHAGTSAVIFARGWRGQDYFRIEKRERRRECIYVDIVEQTGGGHAVSTPAK